MASRASLDLAAGHLQLAGRRVAVRAIGAGGRLQVGGAHGPTFRPPTFGERTRLVAAALGAPRPALALAQVLVATLREDPGPCDPGVEQVLALLLAGAGTEGPPLVEAAALVARATASSLPSVEGLEATQVDFYARALANEDVQDDGWHRVVLAPPHGGMIDGTTDGDALVVQELAESLLARGRARGSEALRVAASPTHGGEPARVSHAERHFAPVTTTHASNDSELASIAQQSATSVGSIAHDGSAPPDISHAEAPSRVLPTMGDAPPAPRPATTDPVTPRDAGHPPFAAAPLLRFRQPPAAAVAPAVAPTYDRGGTDAATGHALALPSTPAMRSDWHHEPTSHDAAARSLLWEPVPWRLALRGGNGHGVGGAGAVVPDGTLRAAHTPVADVTERPARHSTAIASAPLSADDLADRVAESLRHEAARRGLVP